MKDKRKHLIYPIFLPMQGCPRLCIYCDQNKISSSADFDLSSSVKGAAEFVQRHIGKEKEIAFYGGTFTALEEDFRDELIQAYRAVSDEQTSFRISTHPSYIDDAILDWCEAAGIKCIELGIQDFDDEVLKQSGRGYSHAEAMNASKLVKERGFELGVQLMPGLPGASESSIQRNKSALEELKPEYLRLYPLIVVKGTPLAQMYERGEYLPMALEEAISQCAAYLELTHRLGIKVIKLGIPSNIAESDILAGPWHPAFGELVKAEILVRRLEIESPPGQIIFLDKKQYALLMAHDALYLKILQKRIENCSIMPTE
ncbi:MAG: radical SAM protein [Candidatus Cloacimonadaceae bacterium]|nr:radical SAM protein [Candidatus Cloacimonadaceae bacterium]